ncbi:MAG: AMMECR1 domain-containing protein, partial [Halobacteria archaeon]|nr:AMMECR1 domain-containing protein [Halobacteria archaeon]
MSEGLSSERVSRAVCLAREAMESYVTEGRRENPGCMEEVFYERIGVLLKLKSTRGRGSVRGSAASYKRDKQLSDAIVDAAVEASSNKSRSEIKTCEIDTVSVTICFLETIDRIEGDYVDRIEPGEDGLIIEKKQGSKSGWMLPT